MMIKTKAKIVAIEYCLGENKETNAVLKLDNPEWRLEAIEKKTGITQRWISSKSSTSVDLACKACEKIFIDVFKNKINTNPPNTANGTVSIMTKGCTNELNVAAITK